MHKKVTKKIIARWKHREVYSNVILLDLIRLEDDTWAMSMKSPQQGDVLCTKDNQYFTKDVLLRDYPTANLTLAASGNLGPPDAVYIPNNNGKKHCLMCGRPTEQVPGFSQVYNVCPNPFCEWYKN